MTAQDLINSALRKLNVLASGESPTGNESSDALQVLNDMLDSWSTESLVIFTTQPQEVSLTVGKQAYTMGTGGDFNIARPARIDRGVLKVLSNPQFPLELPLKTYTDEEWASITLKSLQNTYPEGYWDDDNFPLRTISFWPVPSSQLDAVFYCWQALTQFSSLTTDHTFPPGYARALRYNLAVELAGEFPAVPQDVLTIVAAKAAESKAKIQAINSVTPLLSCDRAVQSPSTIPGVSRADFLGGRF